MAVADDRLRAAGTVLLPVSQTRFESARGTILQFDDSPMEEGRPAFVLNPGPDQTRMEPVAGFDPSEVELEEYLGTYRSDEAEATYTVVLEDGKLSMKNRWGNGGSLAPVYPDAFRAGGTTFVFRREASGRITEVSAIQGRVWDLRFSRQ